MSGTAWATFARKAPGVAPRLSAPCECRSGCSRVPGDGYNLLMRSSEGEPVMTPQNSKNGKNGNGNNVSHVPKHVPEPPSEWLAHRRGRQTNGNTKPRNYSGEGGISHGK